MQLVGGRLGSEEAVSDLWQNQHTYAGEKMHELFLDLRGFYLKVRLVLHCAWMISVLCEILACLPCPCVNVSSEPSEQTYYISHCTSCTVRTSDRTVHRIEGGLCPGAHLQEAGPAM